MLQGCLNGDRGRNFHPAVPFTPDELARDAERAIEAGADELHVHPRGADGQQSLHPDDVAAALRAIRGRVPGVPVGLSTLWSIPPGGPARQAPIRQWHELPDYVSVNLIEEDAVEIIRLALGKGIGVEAGLWSAADARAFVRLAEAQACLRILVEINEQDVAQGLTVMEEILRVLEGAAITLPLLLHGCDAGKWPFYREAIRRGCDTRIGLEDGRLLPSGKTARDNAELIRAAVEMANAGETGPD